MRTRCIIMASGQSQRMGHNKLAIKLGGKTILAHAIEHVVNTGLSDIVIVYGKYEIDAELPRQLTSKFTAIYNEEYEEGMSSSIQAGLQGFDGDAILIVLGDMPFVSTATMELLLARAQSSSKGILLPCISGKRGNPVLLKSNYFEQLRRNRGDKGAREIIRNNPDDVELCEVADEGILIDIDDEQTLEKYRHWFEVS